MGEAQMRRINLLRHMLNDRDKEVERLRIENIQMQAALGYAIMAEDERHILPTNPYKCGTCDASSYLRAENERLREELDTWKSVFPDIAPQNVMPDRSLVEQENERLRAALREIEGHKYAEYGIRRIARAALDGQPAPSGWRPIETAPKGAEPVLLGNHDEGFIEVGHWWVNTWAGGIGLNGPAFGIFTPIPLSFTPTHWMPLPPAPGKEEA